MTNERDQLCINTIRMLAADAVEKARSGHPGMPMGAAAMAYVLWTRFLRHNPQNPAWPDRDRFVLSAGHGSMLLYSLLHLTGYDLALDELKNFRQWESKTPGHPEHGITPGVETTTGPLGQGFANGVGMAIAEHHLASVFNRPGREIVNHFTYGIVSDGDLMEGISHEAASLAGHLGLGKLIYLYDDNHISIEGSTDIAFTEDRLKRFAAYGWHVQQVTDGNDLEQLSAAITAAREETRRPSFIAVRTHIGYGSPNKQDTSGVHGEPLGAEELKLTKQNLNWPAEPAFYLPEEAVSHFHEALEKGAQLDRNWQEAFAAYQTAHPELAARWRQWTDGSLPEAWEGKMPVFNADTKGIATRVASGKVLNAIAGRITNLMGGSADLAPSTKTLIDNEGDFQPPGFGGRNMRFGVREHAMGGILNGMSLHGGLIPYGATFLIFSDYMRPAIRLAALMKLHVIYVFTHDSIGLGEDGPTHQPIEQLAALRAIPNLKVVRPCDANETVEAWKAALKSIGGPVALVLTRQNLPVLDRTVYRPAAGLQKGAYVLHDPQDSRPDLLLMASGSEVHIALAAAAALSGMGIAVRVVSMPCWELFDEQPEGYRRLALPPEVTARLAIEAGSPQGWHRYVGSRGIVIGLTHFGASAPYEVLYEKFGLTADHVVEESLNLLEQNTR
ncbi:MAG: transketolase [Desulfobacterales bacterium]|jgi:transketolase